jgi:hypothetical protein
MGPRARRRAITGAVSLGVVVVIAGAIVLGGGSPSHTGPAADTDTDAPVVGRVQSPVTGKLVYGMTRKQVLALIGKPAKSLRDQNGMGCWQYTVSRTKARRTLSAVRVCFFSGRYSVAHYKVNGKWDYKPRQIKITA